MGIVWDRHRCQWLLSTIHVSMYLVLRPTLYVAYNPTYNCSEKVYYIILYYTILYIILYYINTYNFDP